MSRRRIVISGLFALSVLTGGCGRMFEYGGNTPPLLDARPDVDKARATLSVETGGRIWACPGISTVFQKTCHFFNLEVAPLEGYLARSGWMRTSTNAPLQGFYRHGLLITYEKLSRGLQVTVRRY